MKREKQKYSNY